MRTSARGRAFIERQEWVAKSKRCGWDEAKGLYFAYKDYKGFWTFGVGHLIGDGKSGPMEFANGRTEAEVDELFAKDLGKYEAAVDALGPMPQNCYDAWVDFAFNEGTGRLHPEGNSALKAFLAGDLAKCIALLPLWDVTAGAHDPGLHARRVAEGYVMAHPYEDGVSDEEYHAPIIDLAPVARGFGNDHSPAI